MTNLICGTIFYGKNKYLSGGFGFRSRLTINTPEKMKQLQDFGYC